MFGIIPRPLWEKLSPARRPQPHPPRGALPPGVRRRARGGASWWTTESATSGTRSRPESMPSTVRAAAWRPPSQSRGMPGRHHGRRPRPSPLRPRRGTTRRGPDRGARAHLPQRDLPPAAPQLAVGTWPEREGRGQLPGRDFALLEHAGRLHLIEGEGELFPDLELIVSEGHTVAQQLPRFHGGGRTSRTAVTSFRPARTCACRGSWRTTSIRSPQSRRRRCSSPRRSRMMACCSSSTIPMSPPAAFTRRTVIPRSAKQWRYDGATHLK